MLWLRLDAGEQLLEDRELTHSGEFGLDRQKHHPSRSIGERALERAHHPVLISKAGRNQREMVRRPIALTPFHFELVLNGLLTVAVVAGLVGVLVD